MKENASFRSSFNGFNREDVVSYISGLMEKIAEGEQETEKLEQRLADSEEALESLRGDSDAWERERADWTARCGSLEEERDVLKKRCEELAETGAAAELALEEKTARIAELERQLSECDKLSKNNEVKLGAAMMEAKRFSEMLVKEANDRAGAVYHNASVCVSGSTADAEQLREKMKALGNEFNRTMNTVMGDMNGLIDAMTAFNGDIRDNGAKFLYRSEFTGDED